MLKTPPKTSLNIKIDSDVTKRARAVCDKLGIKLNTVIGMYLRQLADEREVRFHAPLVPNKKTSALLRQARKDIGADTNVTWFDSAEEMINDLHT